MTPQTDAGRMLMAEVADIIAARDAELVALREALLPLFDPEEGPAYASAAWEAAWGRAEAALASTAEAAEVAKRRSVAEWLARAEAERLLGDAFGHERVKSRIEHLRAALREGKR